MHGVCAALAAFAWLQALTGSHRCRCIALQVRQDVSAAAGSACVPDAIPGSLVAAGAAMRVPTLVAAVCC